ncbi:MAG: tetratricopeptide repeat protein [Planctomycetia bacterium]|nr:tetratricopeptide repeat protein [Planctomycetia bacterium]
MKIRFYYLRSLVALLLCGVCAGCTTERFALPRLSRKPVQVEEPMATATDQAPAETNERARSPAEACRACLTTAREMEAHGKDTAAIEQYERARKFVPQQSGIAPRLAVLHARAGEHELAATEFRAALKEDSTNADLWNDFAYFQFQRAEFVDAELSARKALVIDPDHKRGWVTLGLIEAEQEKYDEAFASFTKAVSPAAAHNNLGIILSRQGKSELADKELAEARRLDPTLKQPTLKQPTLKQPTLKQPTSKQPAAEPQASEQDNAARRSSPASIKPS